MPAVKKFLNIFRQYGLRGVFGRSCILVNKRLKSLPQKTKIYFYQHSVLYQNYLNNKKDITLTKKTQQDIIETGKQSLYQLDIEELRKSDTVFILGSGASVNDLSSTDWQYIASCESIGFNFWMIHDFVPNYYFLEPQQHDKRWETLLELFRYRKSDYKKTIFVIEYKSWQSVEEKRSFSLIPEDIRKNFYLYAPYYLRVNKKMLVAINLLKWSLLKIKHKDTKDIIHHRASISAMIMFSLLAGYKNIVLVGVDLNNTQYFWETGSPSNYKIRPSNIQSGDLHATADPKQNTGAIPIDEYVYLLNNLVLKPRGISLYVASEKSRLYPRIEKFLF